MKKILIVSVFFIPLISTTSVVVAQTNEKSNRTVSTYLHIKGHWQDYDQQNDSIIGFILNNIDTSGKTNWQSEKITDFEKDGNGYFLKANIPDNVSPNSRELWCESIALRRVGSSERDTVKARYGGVKLSKIKLVLQSTPEGAETFLVPNRIWMQRFENTSWDKDDSKIQKFRVNTSSTNTYAFVDETVFVVVYKMNDKYKKTIHFTKPAAIEPEQNVWIKF